jgi:hypothetical protein
MVTPEQCLAKYGSPESEKNLVVWDVPPHLEIGALPNKLYCNKDMVIPLSRAFGNVIERGLLSEVKTWDGCFNIRKMRAGKSPSLHSWAIAIDINAAWNQYGKPPTMSSELVRCFTDAGFDWGGNWSKKDGMHFQLSHI